MSRSGYQEDIDQQDLAMWRGRVMSAIRGQRGQRLIKELRDSLDAMPQKRLITEELVTKEGEMCALGCVGARRKLPNLSEIDPEDHDRLAKTFDVAACLIQEIEFENDEGGYHRETPEQRWGRMRQWCDRHITTPP